MMKPHEMNLEQIASEIEYIDDKIAKAPDSDSFYVDTLREMKKELLRAAVVLKTFTKVY